LYCFIIFSIQLCTSSSNVLYKAAVFSHELQKADTPAEIIKYNLLAYGKYLTQMVEQKVQIVVYPEFGLGTNFTTRANHLPFCTIIPNVQQGIIYCQEKYSNFTILHTASCWAKSNGLYIDINTCEQQICNKSSTPDCPDDGFFLWILNIVFGPNGEFVVKYRKSHPWFKHIFNTPSQPNLVTFTTSFNVTFGIFTCYDIMFKSPAVDLVKAGIKNFLFSVQMDILPGKELHEEWSRIHAVNLLASNLGTHYSGIYSKGKNLVDIEIPNSSSPEKMSIATVNANI